MNPQPAPAPVPDLSDRWRGGHHCGPAEDRRKPSGALQEQHRREGTTRCGKANAEARWRKAEKEAGHPLPDWEPSNRIYGYVCGTAKDREKPSVNHYIWHRRNLVERGSPCEKSITEVAWYWAEQAAGHPLPDWKPKHKMKYACGTADEREAPSRNHWRWHRNRPWRRGEPCGCAVAEKDWWNAEQAAGHPLPDWEPTGRWRCGTLEETLLAGPTAAHYQYHRDNKQEPCQAALLSAAWREAERRAGHPLPEWRPTKTRWQCGTAEQRETPNPAHYHWHYVRHKKRGDPCEKALAERAWYEAELTAGRPLPNWRPISVRAQHICGPVPLPDDQPGQKMIYHHKRDGTPLCGRAKAARSRYNAERRRRKAAG